MAINSGRKKPDAYDEYDRIEELGIDPESFNSFWECLSSDPADVDTEFRKYSSPSHTTFGYNSDAKITTKTYRSGGNSNFGGASNFPRKNFNRRRI